MPSDVDSQMPAPPDGQILIYNDGATRLQVRLEGQTVWLAQRLMAALFQVSVKTVNEHLINIYAEGELEQEATIRRFRIVQREGSRDVARAIDHYNLDAILAVGYRVRSARGTAFRAPPSRRRSASTCTRCRRCAVASPASAGRGTHSPPRSAGAC